MKGNIRDIVIGIIILVVVLGGIYLIRKQRNTPAPLPTPSPVSQFEQGLKDKFNITVPDNVEKADLKNVSGKPENIGEGLATRIFENQKFTFTALANLPDPVPGYFYQVWLVRGTPQDANYNILPLGAMRLAKGGYLLEYESTKDYSDYKNVVITLERVLGTKPQEHILEGSF